MNKELEIINHQYINYINIVFNRIFYRTPHSHTELEIIYSLGCDTQFTVGTESIIVPSDSIVIINSKQVHEIKSIGSTPLTICLQISPEIIKTIKPDMEYIRFDNILLENNTAMFNTLKSSFLILAKTYIKKDAHFEFKCASLIYDLLYYLLETCPNHIMSDTEIKNNDEKSERIHRIMNYAKTHYMNNINLTELAGIENLSVNYLSRFIKVNLNRSLQEYIGEIRLQHAEKLVRTTNKNITDICSECGYSDYRYLKQAFMLTYGVSPKAYRNNLGDSSKRKAYSLTHIYTSTKEVYLTDEEALSVVM